MAVGHWNDSVIDLIPAYKATKRQLAKARENAVEKADKERIGEMICDIDYCLEWLETGRRPHQLRGVERRYERAWDPAWLDRYESPSGWCIERESVSRELTEDERFKIEEAMRDLSPRERQCFMMHYVDGMSFGEIARELHTAKGTVQDYIENARRKIEDAKMTNLFLLG